MPILKRGSTDLLGSPESLLRIPEALKRRSSEAIQFVLSAPLFYEVKSTKPRVLNKWGRILFVSELQSLFEVDFRRCDCLIPPLPSQWMGSPVTSSDPEGVCETLLVHN